MGDIARSKSRIASDLKTRDSNRWRPCDLRLRFETRDWRFVLNTPIQPNCEKGCDLSPRSKIASLVALYRAMRLRFGYGFESCGANGPRNVKNTYLAKHRPVFLPPLLLVGSKQLVLKVPKRGQFHAAIRVTRKRCDSCAQVALGTRKVSRRNF